MNVSRPAAGLAALLITVALLAACAPARRSDGVAPQAATTVPGQDPRLSGYHFMSRATQSLQADDTQNPAFLWVQEGRRQFEAQCSRCHRAAELQDVATRFPAFDAASGRPITLAERIRQCHSRHMRVAAPALESDPLLALESYLAHAARGKAIAIPDDPRLKPLIERGRRWWQMRLGQIDLSCADCHDRLAGQRLAGSTIPQAHPTGYPIYRLEWQGMGSLQRRFRGCLTGVRAEPFAEGDEAWVALELYLKRRAAGMPLDAPAVRP